MHAQARSNRRLGRALATALIAMTLVACARSGRSTRASTPTPPSEPQDSPRTAERAELTAEEPEPSADARIEEAVRGELAADPAVDAALVHVRVRDGVVELRGHVPHLLMPDAAIARAEMVHGVRAVIDMTELARTDAPDPIVLADVEETLRADPAIDITDLSVRVTDGVVALHGTVASFPERRLAERTARMVRGVRDVVSQLEIRTPARRADAEIAADVQDALRADRWVDDWLLDVRVNDGVVSLRGAQPTAAARRRAADAAWALGVRGVDVSLLDVDPDLTPERRRPPAGYVYPDDDAIVAAVGATLARHPRLARGRIDVGASEGVVTLNGAVTSLAAREIAAEAAESVRGVWRVENRLEIRSPRPLSDAEIEGRADRALTRVAALDENAIALRVERGVVTLLGSVESPYARMVAEEAIERIDGVHELRNELEAPPAVSPPMSEHALLQNVIAHLHAHPYVNPEDVEVFVSNRDVMLRGRVTDWRAEREAIRAAYEAGALNVLDDIEVVEGAPAP